MVAAWNEREAHFKALREAEHEGDRLLRQAHAYIKETFFVPGDRDAVYALANELDDIIDKALKIGSYVLLYRVETPDPRFVEMAVLLQACCERLSRALGMLADRANRTEIDALCLQVIQLEDDCDRVYRQALEAIFNQPEDLAALLKWKDLFDWLEDVVNQANQVAYHLMTLNANLH
jgi:predicted phosphate transport protein (TIGR00153 family)